MLSRIIGFVLRAGLPKAAAVLFAAATSGFAAAQQVTTIYSTHPPGVVSVNAAGRLILLQQTTAGDIIVTVSAFQGAHQNGALVATSAIGAYTTTLRILGACSVGGGCDAFGIGGAQIPQNSRRINFTNMDLDTLRQFIASGADINEYAHAQRFVFYNLTYLMANVNKPAHVSLLISAGADVNARDAQGRTMLHYSATQNTPVFDIALALPGVNVNSRDNSDWSVLDNIANAHNTNANARHEDRAKRLRAAGATCHTYATDRTRALCFAPAPAAPTLPNNANKIFVARSETLPTPAIIGILTATQQ